MKTRLVAVMGAVALMALQWTSANASTVLAATDGTVNFIFDENLAGAQLGLFDDSDFGGSVLAVPLPSIVTIAPGPGGSGNFTATNNASATLTLTNQPWFVLGVSTDGGTNWIQDLGVSSIGADAFRLFFLLDTGAGAGSVVAVDVQLAPMVVPAPAALWLFGSGLIGLSVTARRSAMHKPLGRLIA